LARQFLAERGLLSRRWTATSGVLTHIQSGNGDLATQISVVQNFIAQGVDMILISPSDPKGIVPVIRQAAPAGIPVTAVNTKADTGAGAQVVAYVGVDDFVFGRGSRSTEELS
jgi:ribose transport system substrate-binding protein